MATITVVLSDLERTQNKLAVAVWDSLELLVSRHISSLTLTMSLYLLHSCLNSINTLLWLIGNLVLLSLCPKQVLLSYGMYTNLELLEHYGFLLDDNPNDMAFIPLEPDMYTLCSWPKELLYIDQDGKPSFALLSAMRLWATPPNKRRSVGHLAYSGKQISVENEITVMGWIAKKCQDMLQNLRTSIEQDKLLLSSICKIEDIFLPVEL